MRSSDPRSRLQALAVGRGESLAALSTMLGRNVNYLQQWIARGTPRVLGERERRMLANFFGVSETELGAAPRDEPWRVPRLDVAASAGAGAAVEDEAVLGLDVVPVETARALGLREGQAAIIRVAGDSMAPGLIDGDRLLVDQASRSPDAKGGVYVIRVDGALLVKRVRGERGRLVATSDNPAAPPVPTLPIEVVGRAVLQMRRPV